MQIQAGTKLLQLESDHSIKEITSDPVRHTCNDGRNIGYQDGSVLIGSDTVSLSDLPIKSLSVRGNVAVAVDGKTLSLLINNKISFRVPCSCTYVALNPDATLFVSHGYATVFKVWRMSSKGKYVKFNIEPMFSIIKLPADIVHLKWSQDRLICQCQDQVLRVYSQYKGYFELQHFIDYNEWIVQSQQPIFIHHIEVQGRLTDLLYCSNLQSSIFWGLLKSQHIGTSSWNIAKLTALAYIEEPVQVKLPQDVIEVTEGKYMGVVQENDDKFYVVTFTLQLSQLLSSHVVPASSLIPRIIHFSAWQHSDIVKIDGNLFYDASGQLSVYKDKLRLNSFNCHCYLNTQSVLLYSQDNKVFTYPQQKDQDLGFRCQSMLKVGDDIAYFGDGVCNVRGLELNFSGTLTFIQSAGSLVVSFNDSSLQVFNLVQKPIKAEVKKEGFSFFDNDVPEVQAPVKQLSQTIWQEVYNISLPSKLTLISMKQHGHYVVLAGFESGVHCIYVYRVTKSNLLTLVLHKLFQQQVVKDVHVFNEDFKCHLVIAFADLIIVYRLKYTLGQQTELVEVDSFETQQTVTAVGFINQKQVVFCYGSIIQYHSLTAEPVQSMFTPILIDLLRSGSLDIAEAFLMHVSSQLKLQSTFIAPSYIELQSLCKQRSNVAEDLFADSQTISYNFSNDDQDLLQEHFKDDDVQTAIEAFVFLKSQQRALDSPGARFMLAYRLKQLQMKDFVNARLSSSQDFIVEQCLKKQEFMWYDCKQIGMPLWLVDNALLTRVVELMAKNAYMQNDAKNPVACALMYMVLGKKKLWTSLWKIARSHPEQAQTNKFLKDADFSQDRWKVAAIKNGYALLGKQRYEYAAAFFLLGDAVKDTVTVCLSQLKDPFLALLVAKLCQPDLCPTVLQSFPPSSSMDVMKCLYQNDLPQAFSKVQQEEDPSLVQQMNPDLWYIGKSIEEKLKLQARFGSVEQPVITEEFRNDCFEGLDLCGLEIVKEVLAEK